MKVSIIIPIFNTEKYLRECLDSILSQSLDSIEVILIDDGSTDHSGVIIAEYAKRYVNIVAIYQNNRGQSAARNRGLSIATGEYIGFVDSDDSIAPTMYRILYETAKAQKLDIVEAQYTLVKEEWGIQKSSSIELYSNVEMLNRIFSARTGMIWNGIYRAELFEKISFPKKKIGEDLYVKAAVVVQAYRIGILTNQLYFYRQRTGSMTHGYFHAAELDILATNRRMCQYLLQVDRRHYKEYKNNLENMCIQDTYRILEAAMAADYKITGECLKFCVPYAYIKNMLHFGVKKDYKKYFLRYGKLIFWMLGVKLQNGDKKVVSGEKYSIYYNTTLQWLVNKMNGKTLGAYCAKRGYGAVAIYGSKDLGILLYRELKQSEIVVSYFIDRSAGKDTYTEEGIPLIGVEDIRLQKDVDVIIVTPVFDFAAIKMNVENQKKDLNILSLEDMLYDV